MRISQLKITGLFGILDHTILFNTQERVTIIHGPNGVGKTTILSLISNIFQKRFGSVLSTPFKNVSIMFDQPRTYLKVEKSMSSESRNGMQLKIKYTRSNTKKECTIPKKRRSARFPLHIIEETVDSLERIEQRRWLDTSTGEVLDLDQVIMNYGDILPSGDTPDWLAALLKKLPTHFIQTQRLLQVIPSSSPHDPRRPGVWRRATSRTRTTVEEYSSQMVDQIQASLRQSAVVAASLDRTFPHRLLESPNLDTEEIDEKLIRRRYEKQVDYRSRLMKAGLIEPEELVPLAQEKLDANTRRVLLHYLDDVQKKFEVFGDLLKKVELIKDIINSRFLFKEFSIDKEKGFIFISPKNASVPLPTLSSGEQHELVLAFELLFRVSEGALILIDEPELSLHVTWQKQFLDDLERISELANLDFLVATHSPFIVGEKDHLMIPLS